MAIDTFPAANMYPTYDAGKSASLGLRGSASSAFGGMPEAEAIVETGGPDVAAPKPGGIGGQPNLLWAGLTFAIILVALMFTAERIGGESSEFKNLKVSFYNVLVIALAAVAGIPIIKYLFTRFKVPGLSQWVAAA